MTNIDNPSTLENFIVIHEVRIRELEATIATMKDSIAGAARRIEPAVNTITSPNPRAIYV